MSEATRQRFRDYTQFVKRSLIQRGREEVFQYHFCEHVDVRGGVGARQRAYVCDESPCFAVLIDYDGRAFRKKKDRATIVEQRGKINVV